jgi:hypothetical protein
MPIQLATLHLVTFQLATLTTRHLTTRHSENSPPLKHATNKLLTTAAYIWENCLDLSRGGRLAGGHPKQPTYFFVAAIAVLLNPVLLLEFFCSIMQIFTSDTLQ